MKVLNKKLSKNSGFTIVEMLIVVAIIAILIAISIPMFTAALERTRHAVDDANLRDAISLGNIEYLTRQNDSTWIAGLASSKGYIYVVDDGTDSTAVKDYQGHLYEIDSTKSGSTKWAITDSVTSKCSGSGTDNCKPSTETGNATAGNYYNGRYLKVTIDANGDVTATWATNS